MFSSMIDKEIIQEYWTILKGDYEQTIAMLSDMIPQIEQQKEIEQEKKLMNEEEHKRCVSI
jgi:hypothetical protein